MRVLASSFLTFLAFGVAGARAQDVGDVEKGHAFAQTLCAVCHAVETGEMRSPNESAPSFERIAAEPGMTALYVVLRNPHREMPDLILAPEELEDVVAYILTLKN